MDHGWLAAEALRLGVGVGTVVAAVVRAARLESATSTQVKGGGGVVPGQVDLMAALEESLSSVPGPATSTLATAGVSSRAGRVPGGAAPVPRPGAAPARRSGGTRLDVVVARVLSPGAGQIPPAALAQARRLIKAGQVDVSGRGVGELSPELQVGPGEVVVRT